MDIAEFAPGKIARNGVVSHGDDSGLIVSFYMQSVRQGAESEKAGRDIWRDEPYVWIRFAGDRTRERRRPVDLAGTGGNAPDPERWPKQWAAFERQQTQVVEGTPLEHVPYLGASTVLNLKSLNIMTEEALAAVPDSALHNLGHGGRELRSKAQARLKAAADSAHVTHLETELAKRDDDIAQLKAQMAEMARLIDKKAKKDA